MKIHLHAGVHKTATTYVQNLYAQNLTGLNSRGIGYMPLTELRRSFTRNIDRLPDDFDFNSLIPGFFPHIPPSESSKLLISEENLTGYCMSIISSGKPFQTAETRLSTMRRLLGEQDVTLFVCIRNYADFIASAYCEGLRHYPKFVPFQQVLKKIEIEEFSWLLHLERFRRSIEPTSVRIWRYEDFFANGDVILKKLAFDYPEEFDKSGMKDVARPSFSMAAIEALELIKKHIGDDAAARLILPITNNLPKGPDYPAFDPWDDEEKQRLRALYDRDCASFPESYWLVPPGKPTAANGQA
jgi:hypothetical protein